MIRAGVAKTRLSDPLEPLRVETVPRALVVGGGIAGLRAAIGLADVGIEAVVVEREPQVGGWVGRFGATFPSDVSGRDEIAGLIEQIKIRRDITVYTGAELTGKSGSFGNYAVEITLHREGGDKQLSVDVGADHRGHRLRLVSPDEGEFTATASTVCSRCRSSRNSSTRRRPVR